MVIIWVLIVLEDKNTCLLIFALHLVVHILCEHIMQTINALARFLSYPIQFVFAFFFMQIPGLLRHRFYKCQLHKLTTTKVLVLCSFYASTQVQVHCNPKVEIANLPLVAVKARDVDRDVF